MYQNQELKTHPLRRQLINHELFHNVTANPLSHEGVAMLLGQWWHPLHYFPTFLSRAIAVIPHLETKTAISTILFQELGEGVSAQAHENIYIDTMIDAGFSRQEICHAEASPSTTRLLAGYENASTDSWEALGFVYGTEVADLAMVSGIGKAVRRLSGKQELRWVDIHIRQEPGHVDQATVATHGAFSPDQQQRILSSAEEMWRLWIAFFNSLQSSIWQESHADIVKNESVSVA